MQGPREEPGARGEGLAPSAPQARQRRLGGVRKKLREAEENARQAARLKAELSVRFEKGRVTEVRAEKGQAVLEHILSMDEGSRYLGECALVPKESPVNLSGILFYNTLFDENAACHLALGAGFNECVDGFESMSREDLAAMGVNDSVTHVDFMIGSDDLSIDAVTADGRTVPVFRNGTWAF